MSRTIIAMGGYTPEQQARIREATPGWEVIFGKVKELDNRLFRDAEIVLGYSPAVETDSLLPESKLRWIQGWSAGVDKLPLDKLAARGVVLTDASGVHPNQMSETTLALMLAFTRNVHHAIRNQVEGRWELKGSYGEMHGKTIGIIGAGEIGVELANICRAFGMTILGVRRSGKLAEPFDRMYDMSGLDEVLAESDYVVNLLPLTDETNGLFNAAAFAKMKRSAFFVNVGRGPSVVTDDLVQALRDGVIAGAGIDVTEPEPLPEGHPLWSLDNVIITPHIGGQSDQYSARVADLFIHNFKSYIETGRPDRNIVDYALRY
ncbi:phosphoglycerate dehydrogenase-like enzyme [Paenibacillus cellulosilyticus]|uniref:Phosphoglycerate dehydrogenase-like enzyme n=1 Tax=Paenibacillus cellulosilyticus TaxID=375489 RepID=A0A2V2YQJ5_9BACL|nr:D-2-hydroxyacid dehydrogenase [Paenibacillus cellulosilyticus]PWV97978.1 phosphoglycerate dehydrogenase-like enzyme [Paenibacillus cellulosilyticus]QKS43993.1 D-2-hydroxyacid dehydrogenase [Paenibacillus cellulosilyticus]